MHRTRITERLIQDEAQLRAIIGQPTDSVRAKVAPRLNALTRQFIERSPFVCIATAGADGSCDVSPRGDGVGFVRILDDRALLIPERPGNRLADSLRNILRNPRVGLLFIVPGVDDSFRVNGTAAITDDVKLLAASAVEGAAPRLGILVEVSEAYTQCAKAFLRSGLWDSSRFIERSVLPTNGQIHHLLSGGKVDAVAYDAERAARYARREGIY